MKKIKLIILVSCLVSLFSFSFAQEPFYKSYHWEASPKLHVLSANDQQIQELDLKDFHVIEYYMDGNQLVSLNLVHRIIRVSNDKAIEKNNRIYLPLADLAKLLVNKARVINSNGVVREFRNEDIKEGVNEETKASYRYFALEGVDKGSEIECLMVIQQNADVTGKSFILQDETPKRNMEFLVISPGHLVFKAKNYNGLPAFQDSTTRDGRNVLYTKVDSIPGLKEEEFAVYKPNLIQTVIKMEENKNNGRTNLINYFEASQSIFDMMHEAQEKSTTKNLEKLIKLIHPNGKTQEENIRTIENYIKTNFVVAENSEYKSLSSILEFKTTDEVGITKLFTALFEALKINYQIVLTSNRYSIRFDSNFEAYNFLDTYLFYFPDINEYLCPGSLVFRLNCIPFGLTNNYGLFIRPVTVGQFRSGIGEIKFIEPSGYDKNRSNHTIKIDFSNSIANPDIYYTLLFDGNYAQSIQPYYSYIPEESQKEMNISVLKSTLKDVEFSDITVENKGAEFLGLKPLIISAKCTPTSIVEQAGDKFLFKIGELIGPQVELYQEEERKFDIENEFNRSYTREIRFDIPAGYVVKNLDALKMNAVIIENGQPSSYFISNYEIVDNHTVVVKVNEDYKQICYPKSRFQEFRKVVNASADFNKVVLVLEKE